MAWNQPGGNNNNPWGKKPPAGGGDLDQAFKEWQKRVESLFGGGGGGGGFLIILAVIAIGIWMLTGFYTVANGSQGVVQRFGKYVATVPNGWGWRFPWPIEKVTEVDTAGQKATTYKSRVLTSEPNMVELDVTVQWRINDPVHYLFNVRDQEAGLAQVSESAIREVVGRNDQGSVLASNRLKIVTDTRDILQRTLDFYGAGIQVISVNITGAQVPEAVQAAQSESVKAKADKERDILAAQAYANEIIPKAEGTAARAMQDAEAYRSQIVQRATGDAARFNQLVSAYEKAPGVTRERLYIEAIEQVLSRSRKVVIDAKGGNGNMLYLPLDKLLERSRTDNGASITVRPPVTGEAESNANADGRQRVER